jgi:RNA-directed DNA polymerase
MGVRQRTRPGHSFLLAQLGTFPARDMIAGWLKAGLFEAGKGFAPTERALHRDLYVQLNIKIAMNSAGLCAALACWPGDSGAGVEHCA